MINFQVKPLPHPSFTVGKYMKSSRVLSDQERQQEELKKVLAQMNQAEDYIKKQQVEHKRLANDNYQHRNDYYQRVLQNVHDEEMKFEDPSI